MIGRDWGATEALDIVDSREGGLCIPGSILVLRLVPTLDDGLGGAGCLKSSRLFLLIAPDTEGEEFNLRLTESLRVMLETEELEDARGKLDPGVVGSARRGIADGSSAVLVRRSDSILVRLVSLVVCTFMLSSVSSPRLVRTACGVNDLRAKAERFRTLEDLARRGFCHTGDVVRELLVIGDRIVGDSPGATGTRGILDGLAFVTARCGEALEEMLPSLGESAPAPE